MPDKTLDVGYIMVNKIDLCLCLHNADTLVRRGEN